LYRGLLGREPDAGGLRTHADALDAGVPLAELARDMVASEEFNKKQGYLRVRRRCCRTWPSSIHTAIAATKTAARRFSSTTMPISIGSSG